MAATQTVSASLEDYLEAIIVAARDTGVARAKDIAARLDVRSASVTGALRALAEKGLIHYAPYEVVTLTPEGKRLAESVLVRHKALKAFFVKALAIEEAEAESAACAMEHALPRGVLDRLAAFVKFMEVEDSSEDRWAERFARFRDEQAGLASPSSGDADAMGTTLADMKPGTKAKVARLGGPAAATRRLMDMGVTRGTTLTVVRVAPLGDPVEVQVRGYNLSLRKAEAGAIEVERVE